MESRAKVLGHPIHPMIVGFPIALLATSLAFDIVAIAGGGATWHVFAYWLIAIGVVAGLVAAIPGLVDWLVIPRRTRAWNVGLIHGLGNVAVVALFVVNWILRNGRVEDPGPLPIVLSVVAVALTLVTGWLGGELVDRLAVGVDEGANLNSPSSLSHRRAGDLPPGIPRVDQRGT